jgi:hypothetical protein
MLDPMYSKIRISQEYILGVEVFIFITPTSKSNARNASVSHVTRLLKSLLRPDFHKGIGLCRVPIPVGLE